MGIMGIHAVCYFKNKDDAIKYYADGMQVEINQLLYFTREGVKSYEDIKACSDWIGVWKSHIDEALEYEGYEED